MSELLLSMRDLVIEAEHLLAHAADADPKGLFFRSAHILFHGWPVAGSAGPGGRYQLAVWGFFCFSDNNDEHWASMRSISAKVSAMSFCWPTRVSLCS